MIAFYVFMILMGLVYAVLAFVEPPAIVGRFFRIPGIFIFLPNKWRRPVGHLLMAVIFWGFAGYLIAKIGLG